MNVAERRFQVFISSTFVDLKEERQKVLEAVLRLKAFPSGMELFPSSDGTQWDFIKREIDSSDYYVLIVAGKYGSLSPEGISYTEQEYDYAISVKKPVHAFLHKNILDLKASQVERDPAKAAQLEGFRAKVTANRLVQFYTTPEELKAEVLQSLMFAFLENLEGGWVRAENSRRMEDLEELNELQKQLRRLEAENARLKHSDVTAHLAQNEDEFRHDFPLAPNDGGPPPLKTITIFSRWNVLLAAIFRDGLPLRGGNTIDNALTYFLTRRVLEQHPEVEKYANEARFANFGAEQYHDFRRRVRVQFQGLSLIVIQDRTGDGEVWELTDKGKSHLAILIGDTRQS